MIRALERKLLAHPVADALLFNRLTGALGRYLAAARSRDRYRQYRERYDVHPDFEFNGPGITLYGDGDVELGAGSYIGRHSRIQAKDGLRVRIGENTAVSHYVFLYTQNRVADQDMGRAPNRNSALAVREGDTEIGDDCWVGAFTFVTEGASVGDDTVVGANSVVTDDLPPHAIAAGTPATVRRFKSFLDDEAASALAREYADVLAPDVRARYLDGPAGADSETASP